MVFHVSVRSFIHSFIHFINNVSSLSFFPIATVDDPSLSSFEALTESILNHHQVQQDKSSARSEISQLTICNLCTEVVRLKRNNDLVKIPIDQLKDLFVALEEQIKRAKETVVDFSDSDSKVISFSRSNQI